MDISSEPIPPLYARPSSKVRKFLSDQNKWKTDFPNAIQIGINNTTPPIEENPKQFSIELNKKINNIVIDALDKIFPIQEISNSNPDQLDPPSKHVPGAEIFVAHLSLAKKASLLLTKAITNNENEIPLEVLPHLSKLNETCCKGKYKIPLQATMYTALNFVENTKKFLHGNIKKLKAKHKRDNVKLNVSKKCLKIQSNPQQVFSLYKNFIKNKIFVLSKLINGKIKILLENEMVLEITNNWKKIFTSIAPRTSLSEYLSNMPKIPANYNIIPPDFSVSNLRRIIKTKHNTAPGESKISWKCLKHAPDSLLYELSILYEHVYTNNILPDEWYKGLTVLIEKPTDDIGLDRFRPITLLSVEYKLFSHVLTDTLVKILKDNNLIPISQNGFFPDRGSDQCIHTLINIIGNAKQFNNELHVTYLDLAKAFDSVEHWVIEDILNHINAGYLGKVILSTLLHSSTQIETGVGWTESIKFDRGTKQGDIISPVIFALFTAPLLWTLQSKKIGYNIANNCIGSLAIADDLALIASSKENIMTLFNITKVFLDKVGMVVNPKKSASAYRSESPFIPTINGIPFKDLGVDGSYKYLGIHINLELDWGIQIDTCVTTYKASVSIILKKFYLTCNQHIKLINAIAIAALAYRMQFLILPVEITNQLLEWTIHNISKTHSIPHMHIYTQFWTNFKGLINIRFLNLAIYLSNVHKNLNKPHLIAYPILAKQVAPQLNSSNYRPVILHSAVPLDAIFVHKLLKFDLVNTTNLQRIARIFPPDSAPTNGHWEHLSKLYSTNINRTIVTPAPIYPPPINNPPISATAFVDGSCSLITQTMSLAIRHSLDERTFTCNVQGPLNSLEPELMAIELTITLLAHCKIIFIFTDSLSAIKSIKRYQSINTNGKLKTVNRATLSRIIELANRFNFSFKYEFNKNFPLPQNEKSIVFYHIHSHMLTDKVKQEKHWDKHVEKLGPHTFSVVQFNNEVDKCAQKANEKQMDYSPKMLTPGNDLWMAYDLVNNIPIYSNLKNYVYDKLLERDLIDMVNGNGEFAKRIFNPCVSRVYTLHILKSKNISLGTLADFLHKILEKSLSTRLKIHNTTKTLRYKEHFLTEKQKPNKNIRKYEDCFCVWCAINEGKYIAEDTTHVFSECPAAFPLKTELATSLIKHINNKDVYVNSFPIWFSGVETRLPLTEIEREIENFPKKLGDIGFFPEAVVKWVKDLRPKDYKITLKNISIDYIKALHKIWTNRCGFFHKNVFKIEELLNNNNI